MIRSAILAGFVAICAFGQANPQMGDVTEAATAQRIAGLSRQFDVLRKLTPAEEAWIEACKTNCSGAPRDIQERSASDGTERTKAMSRVAAEIHGAIDDFVANAVSPNAFRTQTLQERVGRLLGGIANSGPFAFVLKSGNERHLVISYVIHKGSTWTADTSATVRAYAPEKGRFVLASATSAGMDGYGALHITELHSPVPGELWLLFSGQVTSANGPNMRMRIYAYDGARFRPVWMPENAWGAFKVYVTDLGFTVVGPYYREDRVRNDGYFLAPDGVYRKAP